MARVNGPNQPEKNFLHYLSNTRLEWFKRGRINPPSDCHLLVLNLMDLAWLSRNSTFKLHSGKIAEVYQNFKLMRCSSNYGSFLIILTRLHAYSDTLLSLSRQEYIRGAWVPHLIYLFIHGLRSKMIFALPRGTIWISYYQLLKRDERI